jgi:hypothetical protein
MDFEANFMFRRCWSLVGWIALDLTSPLMSLLGAVCQLLTYAIQSPAPPFPVMILANLLAGFGMALQVSDTLCANR